MANYNRIVLMGNMTRDPELRFTQSGIPVCSFGLAVNDVRSKEDRVDFFNCTAWRGLAETIANYKKKGDPIHIEGSMRQSQYQDKDGNNRTGYDVQCENVQFLSRGNGEGSENGGGGGSYQNQSQQGQQRQQRQQGQQGQGQQRQQPPNDPNEEDYDDIPF